jgi:hypothetical protein
MKKTLLGMIGLFVMSLFVVASKGHAEEGRPGRHWAKNHPHRAEAKARQHHQRERIQQGRRSGELTKEESKELHDQQKDIRETRREYVTNDGKIDQTEMKDLREKQNAASKNIYEEKHDAEKRTAPVTESEPATPAQEQ